MDNRSRFLKYEYLQIALDFKLNVPGIVKGGKAMGFSQMINTDTFLCVDKPVLRWNVIAPHITEAALSALGVFAATVLKYENEHRAVCRLCNVSVWLRRFGDLRRRRIITKSFLTIRNFKAIYADYKKIHGRNEAKKRMAAHFNIKPRSIENYLMGRFPKRGIYGEHFRKGLRAAQTLQVKNQDWEFKLSSGLTQYITVDHGMIRNKISLARSTTIYKFTGGRTGLNRETSGLLHAILDTPVSRWLINV